VIGWGTPEELTQNPASYTGQFLRKKISAHDPSPELSDFS
jgi:excinuclease UvrABC ATPase subunit